MDEGFSRIQMKASFFGMTIYNFLLKENFIKNLYNSSGPEECEAASINGTNYYCEWDYNGLGLEYQLLAGTGEWL